MLDELKYNFQKKDNALVQIILINIIVFVFFAVVLVVSKLASFPSAFVFIENNAYLPANLSTFIRKPWTLLTYPFTHSLDHFFHIIFNMIGLYFFGKIVQEYIGNRRLVNIYILGGIAGGLLYLLLFNTLPYFHERAANSVLLGASGAVFAVSVAAATLVPHTVFHFVFIGPVRIVYIVAFFVFVSFLGSIGANAGGDLCHLGGALFGYLYIKQLQKGTDLGRPINAIGSFIKNIGKPKMKVTYREKSSDKISQKEIDLILDKINKSGYSSLTKEEKQKLFKASQK